MVTISCYLMGGLGNQLFQIFTSISYCIRNNYDLVLPYSDSLNIGIERKTYWNNFLSKLKKYTTFNKELQYTNDQIFQFVRYREIGHHYNEIPNKLDNIMFFGYFQSYKYFENEKENIFSIIKLIDIKNNILNEYPEYSFSDKNIISMHFRLGDYKLNPHIHPILPYEYYYNALSHLLLYTKIDKPIVILYFCEKEDYIFVKTIIDKLLEEFTGFEFLKIDDNIEDWKQMIIMSNCHSNIIANSSFSWWGAYFNNNINKNVYYPSIWFGKSVNNNTNTMFPENWIKIDCNI